ncbi:MAG: hypothetical protein AYK19_14480 [Theionarchaea archaeon DG-70-1]|nr:MAG: hypothetical protein AYK19_14480 [Theionarchaea archaeon DG-70-1]
MSMAGNITVIEGEDAVRTVLSLQFVYKGSTMCGEYGCFISGTKTLKEIEGIMNEYGMLSEYLKDSPSIVMLDADNLGKIAIQNGGLPQLETLVKLVEEIHKDIEFTRLAVDRFDVLSENGTSNSVEALFTFAREKNIEILLTVNLEHNFRFFELCNNYIVVKKGHLPLILFS